MQEIIEALPKIEIKNQNAKHTIVFVHGFNASFDVHEDFYFKYNKANYYSITLPGNNLLPAKKDQLNIEYYAKLIVSYIESKKLNNVILIGHSMGGGIISLVAQQIPNLISKIIFVAPINKSSLDLLEVFFKDYFPQNTQELSDFLKTLYNETEFLNNENVQKQLAQEDDYELYSNETIKILGRSLPNINLMNKLEMCLDDLKIPALLILGEDDVIINSAKCAAYFKEHVKDLEVSIFPKTGHMVFIENSDLYIKTIDQFINK